MKNHFKQGLLLSLLLVSGIAMAETTYLNFAADLTKLQYDTLKDNYIGEEP
ncbi:hypothetical protein [Succinivibrio dextrinosolvens]|uniref:hypothetical protein n=1 Tax=Succinivibrio dextrinosolvens TaxID=83771 RepID=UPI00247AA1B5|nr:hypothetical protein [Succinivibrio dextrinosolvens]